MCLFPRTVIVQSRTFHVKRVIDAPCGKCIECLKKRQNDWKMRICHECGFWSHIYFFTLTYRDSMLPCSVCDNEVYDSSIGVFRKPQAEQLAERYGLDVKSTAYVDDVQNFIKRIRTDYERKNGKKWNVKYFICAEYGPNPKGTKRPHYHGVLMTDVERVDLLPYFNRWSEDFGRMDFVEVGILREDKSSVANYISKYCAKGCFESRAEDIAHKHISRAWSVMSKNIGERWINEHSQDFLRYVPSLLQVEGDWQVSDIDLLYLASRKVKDIDNLGIRLDEMDIFKEVDNLIDNLKVYDGNNFAYSLPRYYRDRLFAVRKVFENTSQTDELSMRICEQFTEECKHFVYREILLPITYKSKVRTDVRYVRENFLSCAIAYRLQQRAIARDRENRLASGEMFYTDENGYIHISYEDSLRSARLARQQVAEAQLRSFYTSNMWKNRNLDFDSDTFTNNNFLDF